MRLRRVTLMAAIALLSAVALAVAANGGDDPVTDRDGVLRVELTEYRIEPERIRTRAGPVKVVARNDGVLTHNVAIVTAPEPGDDEEELARTDTAFPGEVVRLRDGAVVLSPGRYRLVCTIANHDNLGQYAELEVVASLEPDGAR